MHILLPQLCWNDMMMIVTLHTLEDCILKPLGLFFSFPFTCLWWPMLPLSCIRPFSQAFSRETYKKEWKTFVHAIFHSVTTTQTPFFPSQLLCQSGPFQTGFWHCVKHSGLKEFTHITYPDNLDLSFTFDKYNQSPFWGEKHNAWFCFNLSSSHEICKNHCALFFSALFILSFPVILTWCDLTRNGPTCWLFPLKVPEMSLYMFLYLLRLGSKYAFSMA